MRVNFNTVAVGDNAIVSGDPYRKTTVDCQTSGVREDPFLRQLGIAADIGFDRVSDSRQRQPEHTCDLFCSYSCAYFTDSTMRA